MTGAKWKPLPYDAEGYLYEGATLKKAWGELHRATASPFPTPP
jgi:hypothetical protein